MGERKSVKGKFNLISCEFKRILRAQNDSSFDQLEFRSLEPSSLKLNTSVHDAIKESSYSEVIKAFMQKIHERNNSAKSRTEKESNCFSVNASSSRLASSTPFKKSELKNSFNISGIAHLDKTARKKIDCSHNRGGGGGASSLNDSDFESMDQDQYDDDDDDDGDDTKENVNVNNVSVERNASFYEIIKCMQLNSASAKGKKVRGSSEKFKRHSSPYKSGRKSASKSGKLIKVTRENSHAYLRSENQSLASIITTESIREVENYPLNLQSALNGDADDELDINKNESLDFAFTHPNKTESFEASIKNLTQLSSKQSQSDLSSFKRWGQSSLRARDERARPSSLTASESDVYTKIADSNKDGRFAIVGPSSWGQSFELLLNDPNGLKVFAEFLKKEFSGENIYFWTACERYRQIADEAERRKEAIAIYEKHLGNCAHEPVNVDSNARNCSRDGLAKAEIDLFASAQKQIFNLMKFDSYQRFIRSDLYKSCIQAEQKNTSMPYAAEQLDPLLKITLTSCNQAAAAANSAAAAASKLKKSLSNAEDRRRKSLLPWHRKTRCKSKDREEESKKNSTSSSNTLKHNSNQSGGDMHSSRSSLSSFDAAIAKISSFDDETRNSLCRVILRENGATTIVQIKHDETIRELVERVLDKRGFSYQAYEAFLSGTNKPLDLDSVSKELAGNEVFIEQRVVFKLDLPNRKVISVKSKPSKLLCEVLRPILHKYSYRLDMVHAYSKESNDLIDTSLQVTEVDGMRLLILFKDDGAASGNGSSIINNNNNVTEIGQKHVLHNFNMRNAPVTFVRANKLVSSISNPQLNNLDEITNKVFHEVLQCKSTENELNANGVSRNFDQGSIKSEDWGSETETSSGIFNRIRRHKKPQKTAAATAGVAVAGVSKSSAGSERDESDMGGMKKPLIAKWKVGNQKLQVTSRNQNDESLLENLKRAQCLRIEDQRGTDINFELPEFLKDRRLSGQKLRKTAPVASPEEVSSSNLYSNIDSLSPNRNEFNKMNVSPQQKPPQPLPRTSLNNKSSPLKSSPEIASVQSKINSLENAILMSSRSNTPINMNVSTTCMPSTTPIIKNRHSDEFYSENYGDTTMVFNHNHRDFHPSSGSDFQQRLSQNLKDSPPKLPPKRNFYKIADVPPPTNQPEIYLDQPSSSFV